MPVLAMIPSIHSGEIIPSMSSTTTRQNILTGNPLIVPAPRMRPLKPFEFVKAFKAIDGRVWQADFVEKYRLYISMRSIPYRDLPIFPCIQNCGAPHTYSSSRPPDPLAERLRIPNNAGTFIFLRLK